MTAFYSDSKNSYYCINNKTVMRRKFLIALLAVSSSYVSAQVNKIEHFFVNSPQAEKLFYFFRNNFQLPTVWRYQDFGSFSSGALMIGSTPLEFLTFSKSHSTLTRFGGIALEPRQRTAQLTRIFDSLHIAHDKPFASTFHDGAVTDTSFTNVALKNILPGNIYFFTCDYQDREEVAAMEKTASDSLRSNGGGSLGIIRLKSIVIGCTDVKSNSDELSKIPGISKGENYRFNFSTGPLLQLMKADSAGILQIIVEVRSLADARRYLLQKNMLLQTNNRRIFIKPQSIGGLIVELIQGEDRE
jgi:hypothetical protein